MDGILYVSTYLHHTLCHYSLTVPEGVSAPVVIGVGSRELTVTWAPPATPNGVIILYNLFVNGDILFSGADNFTIVGGLLPFMEYTLVLQACTAIGCASSDPHVAQTLPDAPTGLASPIVTVLGPSSVFVTWAEPNMTNGMILRFELFRAEGADSTMFELIFNDTERVMQTTVTGLVPNTLYQFRLLAFNTGGSVSSPTVRITTLEDIPDDISPPVIEVINSTSLDVTWSPPAVPNGEIILYNLTLDGEVIFSTESELSYSVTGLQPFTVYVFSIVACTVRGCGSSNQSTARTAEAIPSGYVEPTIANISSSQIILDISPVLRPNGIVNYVLYVTGEFNSGLSGQLTASNSSLLPSRVTIADLIPFTNYSFFLEAENSAGVLTGPTFGIQTLPAGMYKNIILCALMTVSLLSLSS